MPNKKDSIEIQYDSIESALEKLRKEFELIACEDVFIKEGKVKKYFFDKANQMQNIEEQIRLYHKNSLMRYSILLTQYKEVSKKLNQLLTASS